MIMKPEQPFKKFSKDDEGVIELTEVDLIEENEKDDDYSLNTLIDKTRSLRSGAKMEEIVTEVKSEEFEILNEEDYEIIDDIPEGDSTLVAKYNQLMKTEESMNVENDLSVIGERVEAWGEGGDVKGMSHIYSLYGRSERQIMDNCEDTVVFNKKNNMVALGDGMGGVGSGDKAAKAFNVGMENLDLGDFSGKNEDEIKNLVLKKFKEVAEAVDETGGKITCSSVKFFKTVEGKNKAVIVNVGDSGVMRLGKSGEYEELGEATSAWDVISSEYGNIIDDPGTWATILNGMRGSRPGVPDLGDYLIKLKNIPEETSLQKKFDFHTVMNFVAADNSIDDTKKMNIINLFKNINRQTTSDFSQITEDNIKIVDVIEGDQFILASDGLFDNLDNNQIKELMSNCDFETPEGQATAAEYIQNNINKKLYFKPDDVSFAAIKFID